MHATPNARISNDRGERTLGLEQGAFMTPEIQVETLVEANQTAGSHTVEWDATAHGSGIYFYKLSSNGKTEIKKCVMLK